MINGLNLIHAVRLFKEFKEIGLEKVSVGYMEDTIYKPDKTIFKKYLKIDISERETMQKSLNIDFSKLVELILYTTQIYFEKNYNAEMPNYEISDDLDTIKIFL